MIDKPTEIRRVTPNVLRSRHTPQLESDHVIRRNADRAGIIRKRCNDNGERLAFREVRQDELEAVRG